MTKGILFAWVLPGSKNPEALICIEFHEDTPTSVELARRAGERVILAGKQGTQFAGLTWTPPAGTGSKDKSYWSFGLPRSP